MSEPEITVVEHDDSHRFEVLVDGVHAGEAVYRVRDEVVVFTHTEIDDAFEGKGVGSALASSALDQVRASGRRIVALCPFIDGYVQRHPEYADLVDADLDAQLRR